jgi:hypothetical protein
MAALTPLTVTILARIGDSDVVNEIGTVEIDVTAEPITDENRQPGDAAEAVMRATISEAALAKALRDAADELDPPANPPTSDPADDPEYEPTPAREHRGIADADAIAGRYGPARGGYVAPGSLIDAERRRGVYDDRHAADYTRGLPPEIDVVR